MGNTSRGKLIVFEGIDGSGKSSVIAHLARALTPEFEVKRTKEPFTAFISRRIGNLQSDHSIGAVRAKALLFTADRALHAISIQKWINEGKIVLCDRFYMSTLAYQMAELEQEEEEMWEWLNDINRPFVSMPDLVLYLDSDVNKASSRLSGHKSILRAYEQQRILSKAAEHYGRTFSEHTGEKHKLDADVPLSELREKASHIIMKKLGRGV
ncbi:MAG: dTMP kinase [Methanomassiliicoccales archaeon]